MIILSIILTGIAAFIFGFTLGSAPDPRTLHRTAESDSRLQSRLDREYQNFLSYDGSEQE